jgi:hypothetical protein
MSASSTLTSAMTSLPLRPILNARNCGGGWLFVGGLWRFIHRKRASWNG